MTGKRKRYSAEFKAKVAMEALRGELTLQNSGSWRVDAEQTRCVSSSPTFSSAACSGEFLSRPQDVAFFLASYARDALIRVEARPDLPGLLNLRSALERSLGIAFDARDGEHLFRSTLVQTLFYGLFTAWAAHDHARPFDWRAADYDLNLPVIRLLNNLIRAPQSLRPLDLETLLDAATATLARVDRAAFFVNFDAAHAVQYFYEPFLEFFDPKLRKQLGVWYTPPEIVEYMVERVDRVLRKELGRADGLADPDVWVLDPCCGTGSYIVEVLKRIRTTLEENGLGDLVGE